MPKITGNEIFAFAIPAGCARFKCVALEDECAELVVHLSDTQIDLNAPKELRDFTNETWERAFAIRVQTPESAEGYASAFQTLARKMRERREAEQDGGTHDE